MLDDKISNRFLELGYRQIKSFNGKPYEGNDNFFCVQAPTLYILFVNNIGKAQIEKIGKDGFIGICSTIVTNVSEVDKLHEELNKIILQSDKSSLKKELSKSCLLIIAAILVGILIFSYF